jgi:hypothetical protein
MVDSRSWDWETGEKKISLGSWKEDYQWVEEPYVSPDGEKVAAIVNVDEGEFTVCVNGRAWGETVFDKIWHLRFSPDGRLTALVSEMGEWTMAVDGDAWENKFGYIWEPRFSADGHHIAAAVQQDMQYAMVLNGKPWDQTFANMTYFALSSDGRHTAGAVQVEDVDSGEIHKFQEGSFTAALDGKPWDSRFVNVWNLAISPDGEHLAAEVRLNLYDYTIAVDGVPWDIALRHGLGTDVQSGHRNGRGPGAGKGVSGRWPKTTTSSGTAGLFSSGNRCSAPTAAGWPPSWPPATVGGPWPWTVCPGQPPSPNWSPMQPSVRMDSVLPPWPKKGRPFASWSMEAPGPMPGTWPGSRPSVRMERTWLPRWKKRANTPTR